ncbi:endo-1,4-beta-xylanase [Actinobacteria bacterium YIM 96077]|uniref:Beta-xylanase n=1 Tax=Phytoactinopolyspora halophila TaxID=1981511 RepID=A0A329QXI9_9ACTN|nr:endo-1,4-beta-xylanase [Phytoactinopolyspora halophila]AYY14900.1 endo-1,4-beta-xylanase [Actinobacteria bacterium YIM 96077]RAW15358.1 endo-1,4-beta-xylanase [Phytoactinopolyspora halophila]
MITHTPHRVALTSAALVAAGLIVTSSSATAQETLRGAADEQGLRIGAAVANGPLSNESQYRDVLSTEYNGVTAENSMKWESLQPSQGQFNWSDADEIVDFAQSNGQSVHGHTLVWHSQTPNWVQNLQGQDLQDAMENHINTVMGRYAGDVESWDVVNEPIGDDANLRNSFWMQELGEDYIAEAFQIARSADPNAKLYINDYNIDGINAKSDAYYDLVSDLLDQGVPIDGIGFQGHRVLGDVPSSLEDNIRRFAQLGLEVQLTEIDIRIDTPASDSELEQQRDNYEEMVNACVSVNGCVGVTTWGITDRHSWVPDQFDGQGAALPFDENYNKKPAYYGILEALGGEGDPGNGNGNGDTACEVNYSANDWGGAPGFTASVDITNTGSGTIDGWTLEFTFPGDQTITDSWSADWSQSGADVTATNASWNGTIGPNQSISIGFNGSYTDSNPAPTEFTLNGEPCTTG